MSLKPYLDLLACMGHLGIAVLVLWRPASNRLALLIGLLSLNLFAWNFASFAFAASGRPEWHWLDLAISPFSGALQLHVVLAFVGRSRRFRWVLVASYLAYSLLSLTAWSAFVVPAVRPWLDAKEWSASLFATVLPGTVLGIVLLARHLRHSQPDERARGLVMLAAVLVGTLAGLTEFVDDFGLAVPPMGNVGTLVAMSLMAFTILRLRFLDRTFTMSAALGAVGGAGIVLAAYVAMVLLADKRVALAIMTATTAAFALFPIGRRLIRERLAERRQLRALATLGRLSAQMAHDLRNPLAAIKGGVQFLKEEIAQGRPLGPQGEILEVVAQQVERIEQVVTGHQRLGRVEPHLRPVDLNTLVRGVLSSQPFSHGNVDVRTELADDLPAWSVDRELLECALENLVRNAAEAMPDGGALVVRTRVEGRPGHRIAVITIEDSGCGMDARTAERAFDDFFSTKQSGAGLGLAVVRRIVAAHGGKVLLHSKPGRGTTVTLRLPAPPDTAPP